MKIFNLPDLGEGLAEAEIREWYVKEGDEIKAEQALLAVETAKALVDVPSPFSGKIEKLFGKAGDIIKTGGPLVGFADNAASKQDAGSVVGHVEVGNKILQEAATGIQTKKSSSNRLRATPAVRALAEHLNINLADVPGTGPAGTITLLDVKMAAGAAGSPRSSFSKNENEERSPPLRGFPEEARRLPDELRGARRAMAIGMAAAHREIVPVTLMDYANINKLDKKDLTVKIIRAMQIACAKEPALNAHFDGKTLSRKLFKEVNLGLAVDTKEALYVPIIKNIAVQSDENLREEINRFKTAAQKQSFTQEDLKDLTITLSNFGMIGGSYATPIVVPPTVAILGVGRINERQQTLPLSLTFDHRAVTGGEAARFLLAVVEALEK